MQARIIAFIISYLLMVSTCHADLTTLTTTIRHTQKEGPHENMLLELIIIVIIVMFFAKKSR